MESRSLKVLLQLLIRQISSRCLTELILLVKLNSGTTYWNSHSCLITEQYLAQWSPSSDSRETINVGSMILRYYKPQKIALEWRLLLSGSWIFLLPPPQMFWDVVWYSVTSHTSFASILWNSIRWNVTLNQICRGLLLIFVRLVFKKKIIFSKTKLLFNTNIPNTNQQVHVVFSAFEVSSKNYSFLCQILWKYFLSKYLWINKGNSI